MGKRRNRRISYSAEKARVSGQGHGLSSSEHRAYKDSDGPVGDDELFDSETILTDDALMPIDYSGLDDDDSSSCRPLSKHDAALERAVMEHVHGSSSSLLAWQQALGSDNDDDELADIDRAHAKPANVARRRRRALRAAMEAEDDRLDDELSDWHIDEDTHLATSYAIADEKFEEEVKKLQVKKWKHVSSNLEQILGKRKYSAKACRERHEANELGIALPPIELDPNQEGRRILRDERRKAARECRAEQMESLARRASRSRRTDAEKQRARDEKEHRNLLEKYKREALKAQLAQIRRDRADAHVRKREARKIARARYRLESEWQRAKVNAERTIYKNLTGKYLLGLRPSRGSTMHQADINETAFFTDPEADPDEADDANTPVNVDSDDVDEMLTSKQCLQAKPRTLISKAPISKETLCNARIVMSMAELEVLLHERGLRRRAPREQHAQLVARLAYEDTQLTSIQLSELLGRYFDKGKGSKMSKYSRLQEHDAKHSANGKKGITAADPDFVKGYEGYAGEFRCLLE